MISDEEILAIADSNYSHAFGYQFIPSEIIAFARLIAEKQKEADAPEEMTKLTELIALADAATPGPWQSHGSHIYPDNTNVVIAQVHNPGSKASDFPLVANVAFIAAANPATVKRMAELLMQCREALKNSIDCVQNEYDSDWRHGMPSRKAQLNAMEWQLNHHKQTLAALDAFEKKTLEALKK